MGFGILNNRRVVILTRYLRFLAMLLAFSIIFWHCFGKNGVIHLSPLIVDRSSICPMTLACAPDTSVLLAL
jgi:hypothetical protein